MTEIREGECFICHQPLLYSSDEDLAPNEGLAHRECLDRIMHGSGVPSEVRKDYNESVGP